MSDAGYVFQTIKESRDSYFIEYSPARAGNYSALLALVFTEMPAIEEIASIMEQEARVWVQRYPVPVMVTAYSDTDDVISIKEMMGCDDLIALPMDDEVSLHWKLLKNEEFPSGSLLENQLRKLYEGLPCTTLSDRKRAAIASARFRRIGFTLIALWGIIVPAAVALFGLASPILGGIVIAYSIGKAVLQTLKMLGYVRRSEREKEQAKEDLRMRHHHYHCERNPEGFMRLKAENFEREVREDIHREAAELKQRQTAMGGGA